MAGRGDTSAARRLSTGSSGVLLAASSLRSFARTQPPCTKVSLPSGRTSLIVVWRSTFGVDDRTHRCRAPAPMTVVFSSSGLVSHETAVPSGSCVHLYGGVAVHSPSVPEPVSPEKSVSGRACGSQVKLSVPVPAFFVDLANVPSSPTYHDRALVPGIGKRSNECSKPGYGQPGLPALPAPLSNRTRIEGSAANADSARS